ncbi:MAG: hypothetical protein ACI84R_003006 [Candidatus Azotimanducaceae bacterium]|jgi:hypothetical protein
MTTGSTVSTYESITGGSDLLEWFGRVPSFHDAEVLNIHLRREGRSTLTIHTWNMTDRIKNGYFVLEKHAVVEFSIDRIYELELDGFNHQNVIRGLDLTRVNLEDNKAVYELSIDQCYGLSGSIRAEKIAVKCTAVKP